MKKLLIIIIAFLILFESCKKGADITPMTDEQLSETQIQILESAGIDTTSTFRDAVFPDGSNIYNWKISNDSGYNFVFGRVNSLLSASDKKNLFIARMTEAGLRLADDRLYSYPLQPNGIAYVWGSKSFLQPATQHQTAACQQQLHGLDCSGMIYQMAKASNLNFPAGETGTVHFVNTSQWNTAFTNSNDFNGLEMSDMLALSVSQLQAGDIIVAPHVHIGMVFNNGTTLGILNSLGRKEYSCSKNADKQHGPVITRNIQVWLQQTFGSNYHVLRVKLNGGPGVTTNSINSITQVSAITGGNITNEGGAPVSTRGVCWNTTSNPTINNTKTIDGNGTGIYTSLITGLSPNTTYYIRAYATNSIGTNYGNEISFTTNGLASGEVLSPTGRIWMDRNLGATRVATSSYDHLAYGYLYQWGRGSDGHQLINWAGSTIGSPVNGFTTTLATTNSPGHNLFIDAISSPSQDWRNPSNDNLWQGINGINNPCPAGFRLPTWAEFNAEIALFPSQTSIGAFQSVLKLPAAGRRPDGSSVIEAGGMGHYWISTVSATPNFSQAVRLYPTFVSIDNVTQRMSGFCIRCIKD